MSRRPRKVIVPDEPLPFEPAPSAHWDAVRIAGERDRLATELIARRPELEETIEQAKENPWGPLPEGIFWRAIRALRRPRAVETATRFLALAKAARLHAPPGSPCCLSAER